MKTVKILAIMLLCFMQVLKAQPPGGGKPDGPPPMKEDKIEAMKIGFITDKLDLSPEEAQKFWPVYNKFQAEMKTIRESRRNEMGDKGFDSLSDKEVEKMLDNELARRQQEVDLLKKYNTEFRKVLPIRKVAMLFRLEEDFKRELLRRIQEKKDDKQQQRNSKNK